MTTWLVIWIRFSISGVTENPESESNFGVCVNVFIFLQYTIGTRVYDQGFRLGTEFSSNHAKLRTIQKKSSLLKSWYDSYRF